MLKQIADAILVTGPFKINGVPLRRINPAYVIATSTKIDLSHAGLSLDKFDEAYFKVKKDKKGKSTEEDFFGEAEKVPPPSLSPRNAMHPAFPRTHTMRPRFHIYQDADFGIIEEGDF